MDKDRVKTLVRRYEALLGGRSNWHQHWDDLARVMLPRRMGFVTQTTPGDRRTEDIYDGTPMQAARGLTNAVDGFLWPDGQKDFSIKAEDDDIDNLGEVKDWTAAAEEDLKAGMENPRARFRQARGEKTADLVVFGTGTMFIGESAQRNSLLYQSLHLKDAVTVWNDDGEPEGMFRCKRMTLEQAGKRFGNKLSPETKQKIDQKKNLDEKIKILHVVVPRPGGNPNAILARNLPFADMWIEMDTYHLLETGGFHEFPFVVPRWDSSSGEDYGRSPGMIALPDANTLQAMGETILVAGQRAADPPIAAPNDGTFTEVNTFPGGLFYYDVETAIQVRGNPFFPLETGGSLPMTRDMQLDVREQVWAAFFRNVLNLPVDGPQMTAEEIRARKEEFIREIGPVFGRLETDDKAPTVERSFNIMLRAGALPPIPDALAGKNIRFEYESPVKRVRQQIDAAIARAWVMEHVELANLTQNPAVLDAVNFDKYSQVSAEYGAVPREIVNSEEVIQATRAQRAEQQAAQAEAAQMQQMAEIAKTGADAAKAAGLTEAA